jgi:hypothetical protein
MNTVTRIALATAAGGLLLLGGCASSANDTHRHGPRRTMEDSAMREAPDTCPYEDASHDMHRPRGDHPMPTAAHPGCRPGDAETNEPAAAAQPE